MPSDAAASAVSGSGRGREKGRIRQRGDEGVHIAPTAAASAAAAVAAAVAAASAPPAAVDSLEAGTALRLRGLAQDAVPVAQPIARLEAPQQGRAVRVESEALRRTQLLQDSTCLSLSV